VRRQDVIAGRTPLFSMRRPALMRPTPETRPQWARTRFALRPPAWLWSSNSWVWFQQPRAMP